MKSSRLNQRLNSNVQDVVPDQVTHAPPSEDELARVFPGLDITNVETSLFNLINLIHHLWGNHGGVFRANAQIPKPSDKQLILALLNLVTELSVDTADKLLKFCVDENYTEEGINFKRIHDFLLNISYLINPLTLEQFDAYINNQENGGSVATLIDNITYSTPSARQIGIDTLLRLLVAPSKNIDRLRYILEMVDEFTFVENDPIDKESMQKLAQQFDQHVYKQNDVIVTLVDKIKSKIPYNYIAQNKTQLEQQITQNQLSQEYLDPQYIGTQLQKIGGLSELMQLPFVSYLTLTNLSELIENQSTITSYQAYEIIINKWISAQISNKGISKTVDEIFEFTQKVALTLTINQMTEIDLSQLNYYIDEKSGARKRAQNQWDWFRDSKELRILLPLESVRPQVYQFMHRSIQEFLVVHHLYTQLMQASEFTNLDWNKIDLTSDNSTCYGIVSFLVDIVGVDELFKTKISELNEQAKIDQSQIITLANTHLFMHKYSELCSALKDGDVVKVRSIVIRILRDKSLSKNEKIDFVC